MRRLMPLRLPSGWAVVFNNFVEFAGDEPPTEQDNESYRAQDLLSLESIMMDGEHWRTDSSGLVIDVGWYPDSDPSGAYRVCLVRETWADVPIRFEHRDCYVIKEAIELITGSLAVGKSPEEIGELLEEITATMTSGFERDTP